VLPDAFEVTEGFWIILVNFFIVDLIFLMMPLLHQRRTKWRGASTIKQILGTPIGVGVLDLITLLMTAMLWLQVLEASTIQRVLVARYIPQSGTALRDVDANPD
jgi:hypothetical protein